jgi:hypothetical protein
MTGILRTTLNPGWPPSTRKRVQAFRPPAGASVTAATMRNPAPSAPVAKDLWPSMTNPDPFARATVRIIEGSEPAPGAGSVMAKAERQVPWARGRR